MAVVDLRCLAACRRDFAQYLPLCEILEKRYSGVSFSLNEEEVSQHQIDKVSLQIIPDSFKELFLPARSTGDGNCLFNSASIAFVAMKDLQLNYDCTPVLNLLFTATFTEIIPYWQELKFRFSREKMVLEIFL